MTEPFAAYLRTSTEDSQSPEDSKRWQLSLAEQLIRPHGGAVTAVYHDIDVSRSVPWSRRPEAKRLLAELPDHNRGWTRLVIGEPQRAFSGAQFQLVFPVLCHYDVELWVPEIGGPVDPDSEAHDLVMSLFGGLSKAERRRIQHRPAQLRLPSCQHRPPSSQPGQGLGGGVPQDPRARPRDCARSPKDLRARRHRCRVPIDRTKTGS
jgi:DNA invertase Pin-like site-specific DNA recombinase